MNTKNITLAQNNIESADIQSAHFKISITVGELILNEQHWEVPQLFSQN